MSKSLPEIVEISAGLDKEAKAIEKDTFRLAWYMRGGLTTDEAFQLTYEQKQAINEIVKENMEWTKESGMPLI